jgi:hypothetical protein
VSCLDGPGTFQSPDLAELIEQSIVPAVAG